MDHLDPREGQVGMGVQAVVPSSSVPMVDLNQDVTVINPEKSNANKAMGDVREPLSLS